MLVAEDDPAVRTLISRTLERYGFTVTAVDDGAEAIRSLDRVQPRAIVTDFEMPEVDDLDVCRAARMHPTLRTTPVLLYTGGHPSDERLGAAMAPNASAPSVTRSYKPPAGQWVSVRGRRRAAGSDRTRSSAYPDLDTLHREVSAWELPRNQQHATVSWHFTAADARRKLSRFYERRRRLRSRS